MYILERCSSVDVCILQNTIKKEIDTNYPDASENEKLELMTQEFDNFRVNDQNFKYTYLKNHFGGYRWFFVCDKCGNKYRKLFLPPKEYVDLEQKYLCKECHNLYNESVISANKHMYKKVLAPLKKMQKIEKKLEKGYLRGEKIEELLNEYEQLEASMKSSTEYRLFAFRKKREQQMKIISKNTDK